MYIGSWFPVKVYVKLEHLSPEWFNGLLCVWEVIYKWVNFIDEPGRFADEGLEKNFTTGT
jgi:hypothetical protein